MTLKEQRELNKPTGKTLSNLSQYIITNTGKVWSLIKDRYLTETKHTQGYIMYYLTQDDNKKQWYKAHRLVAMAYKENPNNYPIVLHLDNNPTNNHEDNLKWGTHKMNTAHAIESGSFKNMPKGANHALFGKSVPEDRKLKMSKAKLGESHPKFKGYYKYNGITTTSLNDLAKQLNIYPMKARRMWLKGLIEFKPKSNLF
jgi:hypothetical protein